MPDNEPGRQLVGGMRHVIILADPDDRRVRIMPAMIGAYRFFSTPTFAPLYPLMDPSALLWQNASAGTDTRTESARSDDDDSHLHRLLRRPDKFVHAGGVCRQAAGKYNDLPQDDLNGPFGRIIQVQNRRHIRVPVGNRIKERYGRNGRHRQRNHDSEQDSPVTGPVDLCGFLQSLRQVLKEVSHDDKIEGIDRCRDNQRRIRIDQPHLLHHENVGIIPPLNSIVNKTMNMMKFRPSRSLRDSP